MSDLKLPPEVQRARAEDPEFAEAYGRARAIAAGVTYDPEIHHPDRIRVGLHERVTSEAASGVKALIRLWESRDERRNPYLKPRFPERSRQTRMGV